MKSGSAQLIDPSPARLAEPDTRARTLVANERSFLAGLRSGLSLTAVGIAVAGFLPVDLVPGFSYVAVFAILLVLTVMATMLYGVNRNVRAFRQIYLGSYDPTIAPLVTAAATIGLMGILAMSLVLLQR